MNEANDLQKPEPAGWPGRVDRLVGHSSVFVLLSCPVICVEIKATTDVTDFTDGHR